MLRPISRGTSPGKRLFELARENWAADGIDVTVSSCRVLELWRQQYYRWRADPVTDSERDTTRLANAILDATMATRSTGIASFLVDEVELLGWTSRADGMEDLLDQSVVVELREDARPQRHESRPTRARRPTQNGHSWRAVTPRHPMLLTECKRWQHRWRKRFSSHGPHRHCARHTVILRPRPSTGCSCSRLSAGH